MPVRHEAEFELAVRLRFNGKKISEVAKECKVNEKTVDRWLKMPEFKAKLQALYDEVVCNGKAKKENRIRAKRRRIGEIQDFLKKRAENPALGGVIGDPSGLYIQRQRSFKDETEAYQVVTEIFLDRATASELRALEESIAIEKGELQRKLEISTPSDELTDQQKQLAKAFTPEQVEAILEMAQKNLTDVQPPNPDGDSSGPGAGTPAPAQ